MRYLVCLLMFLMGLKAPHALAQGAFDQTLTLRGARFHVSCPNEGSQNTLRIVPGGSLENQRPIEQQIDGAVVGAEVADLDGNGAPELYVFVQSAGSGSYGSVVGYAVNRGASISPILMPELTDDPQVSAGYMGHDRFNVSRDRLVRQFPLYRPGDTNAAPSGGARQLSYRLAENGGRWVLQLVPSETRDSR